MKYSKPPLNLEKQVALWESRGLRITDRPEAIHHFKHVGYYRLSGYSLPFQIKNDATKPPHTFKPGTEFADILRVYRFDCQLRLIIMEAVEKIEVAFRTYFSNTMCDRHGPFWYLNKAVFEEGFNFGDFISQVEESTKGNPTRGTSKGTELFLRHYFQKYNDPPLPPSWMIVEVVSFSTWSRIYPFLRYRNDKKAIADMFALPWEILNSWIHSVAYVRNLCAHHSRLWNREFTITPSFANHPEFKVADNTRLYAQVVVLGFFMKKIAPSSQWNRKIIDFVKSHPFISLRAMGFPNWVENVNWHYEI